jgi:hypothetical protein
MTIKIVASLIAALALAVIAGAQATKAPEQFPPIQNFFDHGAWICDGGGASSADDAIAKFYREGKIQLTDSIIDQLTKDYGCRRVTSDSLRVTDFNSDEIRLDIRNVYRPSASDDADPDLNWNSVGIYSYLLYMQFHVMQPNQTGGDEAWFCSTQSEASHFGQSIGYYQWKNIRITYSLTDPIAKQLATDNHCGISKLGALRPIEFAEPHWDLYDYCYAFKVTDGNRTGWMPLEIYLAYARNHVVSHR